MASMFLEAVRKQLEADLACDHCGAMNDPKVSRITVDINGNATCSQCGAGGDYRKFQRKDAER